ncbi:upstream stimulatory factor 1-like isoform X3 [Carassius carassius]|uniref:upstream stimulatory factor 1-like isoform X3 n=1 Tax=Carassius carassius TaxID=217509 RepID=UPI0028694306|nr:upstream stimulatory factor 1-like isoform X3 [Carassius carassius]
MILLRSCANPHSNVTLCACAETNRSGCSCCKQDGTTTVNGLIRLPGVKAHFTWYRLTVEMKGHQKSSEPDVNVPVIEEGAVATAEDPSAITTIQSASTFSSEQPIKYLFKTEGAGGQVGELYPPPGQVTYRVIQVADGQLEAQTESATAVSVVTGFPATTQPLTQAVFSQSEGLDGDGTETHYTYYPATISDAAAGTMVTGVQASDALLSQSAPAGQLYVMMSPQEVLTGANQSKTEGPRNSRDDKRRAQHNEVERRRRDKINNWIVQLSKTIPDCTMDSTKTGQSKGGILSKACDYIQELRQSNSRLGDELNTLERLKMDNQLLRQEVEDWKSKNQILRSRLRQHGIVAAASAEPQ